MSRPRVIVHYLSMAITVGTGCFEWYMGGPNYYGLWYYDYPIVSLIGNVAFAAFLLNLVQAAMIVNEEGE
jgi:hypothetical protein